jgi:hypothetical protein
MFESFRCFVSDDEVLDSVTSWILDTGNTRSRVSQYLKTVDIYWHMKLLLGHVLVDRKDDKNEICSNLMKFRLNFGSTTTK